MPWLFSEFLKLGLIAFGGPAAHIAWFQRRFVQELGWLSQERFNELLALCQLLPGPTSSQLGMAIGHERQDWPGAIAAFIGFTLPSALLMLAAGSGLSWLLGWPGALGLVQGLKLLAVLIVAQALAAMARSLLQGTLAQCLMLGCLAVLLLKGAAWQLPLLALCALAGALWLRQGEQASQASFRLDWRLPVALALVTALAMLPLAGTGELVRTGALVFGGGHVVLPLLADTAMVRDGMNESGFLAGYGLAQALPGPLFSFAAYIGSASSMGPGGLAGGLLALLAIYLPSFLLLWGLLPNWQQLRRLTWLQGAIRGANAAVIAFLGQVWYQSLLQGSVTDNKSAALLVAGAALLYVLKLPAWLMALLAGLAGAALLS
ncbi:chromate efflux transporter [Gallaecimonas kandeliae]|uniref:chromate efflux transporter n=1 Tax=Gallaecimonas kandeliae TaxID=3029055 RepID=UPI0026479AF8|nr:chromate efflux transporter [Gallaecimonas kandeliae]WKE66169.1 chromate efflux transporter [Gallaecimonas kandeliae]